MRDITLMDINGLFFFHLSAIFFVDEKSLFFAAILLSGDPFQLIYISSSQHFLDCGQYSHVEQVLPPPIFMFFLYL